MKRLHIRAEEAGNIKTVFKAIGRDAGVACFSYGCGPALVAASDPEIQNHVRFGIAFGGYFDIREALEHVVTGRETPTAYLKWAYLAANSDLVTDETDQSRVRKIAETLGASNDDLSPVARSLLDVFSAATPEDFRARLEGITGDCLGAANQLTEVGLYLTAVILLRFGFLR